MNYDEVLEKIRRDYEKNKRSGVLQIIEKQIDGQAISYNEAYIYAEKVGNSMSKALEPVFLSLSQEVDIISGDEIESIVQEMLRICYEDIIPVAKAAQEKVNREAGTGLSAIKSEFDERNAKQAARAIRKNVLGNQSGTGVSANINAATRHVVDGYMETNVAAHENAGLKVKITRRYDNIGLHGRKEDCQFCLARCGEDMSYFEAKARKAFQRHVGCGCEIFYKSEKVLFQKDWEHNKWERIDEIPEEERKSDTYYEYLKSANPGTGNLVFREGNEDNRDDEETARWLWNIFGGDIRLQERRLGYKKKTPDAIWNGVQTEFKRVSSFGKIQTRIGEASEQFQNFGEKRYGRIVLDITLQKGSRESIIKEIYKRGVEKSKQEMLDIIIRDGSEVLDIIKIEK